MIRAIFFHGDIHGLSTTAGLQQFLQRRLVIGKAELAIAFDNHALQFGLKNLPDDKCAGYFKSGIQVHRCDEGFQCIRKQRRLGAASAPFLAASQAQIFSYIKAQSRAHQMTTADQVRLELR